MTYYMKNREKCLEYQKEYNKSNQSEIQSYNSFYWQTNRRLLTKKRQKYEMENYDRLSELRSEWYFSRKESISKGKPSVAVCKTLDATENKQSNKCQHIVQSNFRDNSRVSCVVRFD